MKSRIKNRIFFNDYIKLIPCYSCDHGAEPGELRKCNCPDLTEKKQYQFPTLAAINYHCPYYQGNDTKRKTPDECLWRFGMDEPRKAVNG